MKKKTSKAKKRRPMALWIIISDEGEPMEMWESKSIAKARVSKVERYWEGEFRVAKFVEATK